MQFWRICGAQDQHVESGQDRVYIVIVKNRIRQTVEIVQRPDRLGQFLMQTIARLLRAGIIGQEYRHLPPFAELRPVGAGLSPVAPELRQTRHVGHNKAGRLRQRAADIVAAHRFDGDIRGLRGVHLRNGDPRLGFQPPDQTRQILRHLRCRSPGHPHRDRPVKAGEHREFPTAFQLEMQIQEIARDIRIRHHRWTWLGQREGLHRGQRVFADHHCPRRRVLHRRGPAGGQSKGRDQRHPTHHGR